MQSRVLPWHSEIYAISDGPHFTAVKSKLVSYTAAKHIVCLVKKNKGVKTVLRLNCWKWGLKWHIPLLHPDVDLSCRWLRSKIQYITSLCSSWIRKIFSSTNAQAGTCGSGATCYQVLLYAEKKSFPLFHSLLGNNVIKGQQKFNGSNLCLLKRWWTTWLLKLMVSQWRT